MNLAKDGIDIGLRTNHIEPMLEFWTNEIGLPYDELLKTGPGARQHRLRLNGSSILKINHHREPQPDTRPSGYRELFIAQDIQQPVSIQDPDGNPVTLVPHGWQDIERIGMRMCVRSLAGSANFFVQGLKAEAISANRFRWATSVFILDEQADLPLSGGMQGLGYRYTTVQVYKTDTEHQGLLKRGATEGLAPTTLGTTARISFIRDPDNNWIEISQRASLTGDLEPG